MKHLVRRFNLMEVMVALGLLAIGLVAVMGLIPIALLSSRDAMAATAAAESADLLLNRIRSGLKEPNGWDVSKIPTAAVSTDSWSMDLNTNTPVGGTGGSIIKVSEGGYRLIRYTRLPSSSDSTSTSTTEKFDSSNDALDFVADATLWKEKVKIGDNSLDYEVAVALKLEVSWPATLPYERRFKSLYTLEVFKNNK